MISVILPCWNEVRHGYLERILRNLQQQAGSKEILAVLSPSEDGTEQLLQEAARDNPELQIVRSLARNRAQRLNAGLQVAQGEQILLHHPATLLPEYTALQAIQEASTLWGGFRHRFDLDHPLLRFTSWYSNEVRGRRKGVLYLDHCIFCDRAALLKIGGVPDMDIFEDTVLSDRLRQLAMPVILPGSVITSARRFRQRGIWQQALLNQVLKAGFLLGIDPQVMNTLYERKTPINSRFPTQE